MRNNEIRQTHGLQLRNIGRQYMIVDAVDGNSNLCNVYSLNRTAARIWKRIGECTPTFEELADWLCDTYEVDKETSTRDLKRLLEQWETDGLIERSLPE